MGLGQDVSFRCILVLSLIAYWNSEKSEQLYCEGNLFK
jgi:hypothetical protein